jgi:hypothetical protein
MGMFVAIGLSGLVFFGCASSADDGAESADNHLEVGNPAESVVQGVVLVCPQAGGTKQYNCGTGVLVQPGLVVTERSLVVSTMPGAKFICDAAGNPVGDADFDSGNTLKQDAKGWGIQVEIANALQPIHPVATFAWVDKDKGRMACGNDIAYVGLSGVDGQTAFFDSGGGHPSVAHVTKTPPKVGDPVTLASYGSSVFGNGATLRKSGTNVLGVGKGSWGPKKIPIGEGEILIDDGACKDESGAGIFTPSGEVVAVASRCMQGATIATVINAHASPPP